MKIPSGPTSLWHSLIQKLVRFYEKTWVKFALAPVIHGTPPVLVTAFYANETYRKFISANAAGVAKWLTDFPFGFILVGAIYPSLIFALGKAAQKKVDSHDLNVDGLLYLIAAIDSIVGVKGKRFSDVAWRICSGNQDALTKENAFCHITQPMIQISETVRGIADFFNATRPNGRHNLIRVVLAVMRNDKVSEIPIHFPSDEPPQTSVETLSNSSSSIMTACRTRRVVVIDDISKELKKSDKKRKFAQSQSSHDNQGSLICYPVVHIPTNTVPFVISIHCDQSNYFKYERADLYEHSLQRFALRLSYRVFSPAD